MRPTTSTYLDLLRFNASGLVFLSHLSIAQLSGGFLWQIQPYGHSAVIVFFVLSGYVISFTAATKDRTLEQYAINRLARLYSVVIPAIVLAFLLDRIGMAASPDVYLLDRETAPLLRVGAAVSFLSESWLADIPLFSDDAFWSLPYEFWYYVIFAGFTYFAGRRRALVCGAAMLIAGPKILLLLPTWLFGAVAFRISRYVVLSPRLAWSLFILSLGAAVAIGLRPRVTVNLNLFPPNYSPSDYALAAAIGVNIIAANGIALWFGGVDRLIRWTAGFTFSLYLFHLPLLHLFSAFIRSENPLVRGPLIGSATVISVIFLGLVTEQKKQVVRRWIIRSVTVLKGRFAALH
ncbi:MAG TPA: acyltransferase family protein [Stellaceae bacterium]|nr:acyltransferase family protein [Stellaceae bacterium]